MADIRQTIRWVFETSGALSSIQKVQRNVKRMQNQFKGLQRTVAAVFAIDQVRRFATESSNLAKQFEGVQKAFNARFDPSMFQQIREATRGTVDDLKLMQNAVRAEQLGLPMQHFAEMLAFAQQRARETGESVERLVEQLVLGIGRQSVMRLDDLGLNARRVNEEFKKTGDFAAAVALIIEEEMGKAAKITGGFAEVSENASAKITNLKLMFGQLINKAILPLVRLADKVLGWFSGLDNGIKIVVLSLGGLLILVPALVIGIGAISAAMGTLSAASLPITGTILAIVAAIGALAAAGNYIYQNWQPIVLWFENLWVKMKNAMIDAIAFMVEKSTAWLSIFGAEVHVLGAQLRNMKSELPHPEDAIKFKSFGQTITDTVGELGVNFGDLQRKITGTTEALNNFGRKALSISDLQIAAPNILQGDETQGGIVERLLPITVVDEFGARLQRMQHAAQSFSQNVTQAIRQAAENFAIGIGSMIGSAMAGRTTFADMGKFVLQSFAGMLHQLGVIAIQTGIAVQAIKTALKSLNPIAAIAAGVALIALASFVRSSVGNLANGSGGGSSGPGQLWSQRSVPQLAEGGIATRPTLAMIGEGGEDEAILPLSKLRGMLTNSHAPQIIIPDVRISGNDILILFEKATQKRNKYYKP
jgi:hypothetical protein